MSKVKVLTAIAGIALAVAPVAVIAEAGGHSAAQRPAAIAAPAAAQPADTASATPTSTASGDDTPWG